MGILDGYAFDPATYAGSGAPPGWLGLLLGGGVPFDAQQPSQGFPDQLPANAAPASGGVTLPQPGISGFGREAEPQNPFAALFSRAGNAVGSLFSPSQANAQPAQQAAPQAPQTPQGPDFLDRLSAGATNFTTGGNPIAGIINSIRGLTTGQRTDPAGIMQQQVLSTYHALVGAGVPAPQAQAMALNPKLLQTVAPEYFGGFKVVQTGEGPFGDKQFMMQGPGGHLVPLSAMTTGGQAADTGGAPGSSSFLAPGVSQINSSLSGDDYLKQFSPEIQAAVQNYVEGKSMPTGNPRKGFTQAVKMIAQKYGQDIGMPSDDTTFNARSQMRKNLSTGAPNSLGGQINIGNTAIGHLEDLSQKAIALDNSNGLGLAPLGHAINAIRGLTTDQAAKIEALKGAAQHYGQEITKFYAGSPGGEGERNRFLSAVDGAKTPQELANVIATEAELMHSRLQALGAQIQGTLGDAGLKQYAPLRPESEQSLGRISANVDRLKNGGGAPQQTPQAAPAAIPPPGQRQVGQTYQTPKGPAIWRGNGWELAR